MQVSIHLRHLNAQGLLGARGRRRGFLSMAHVITGRVVRGRLFGCHGGSLSGAGQSGAGPLAEEAYCASDRKYNTNSWVIARDCDIVTNLLRCPPLVPTQLLPRRRAVCSPQGKKEGSTRPASD